MRAFSSARAPPFDPIMAEPMTDEQIAARLAGVRAERETYLARGMEYRVAACDVEIARLTGKPVAPAHQARAVRRPRVDPERETR